MRIPWALISVSPPTGAGHREQHAEMPSGACGVAESRAHGIGMLAQARVGWSPPIWSMRLRGQPAIETPAGQQAWESGERVKAVCWTPSRVVPDRDAGSLIHGNKLRSKHGHGDPHCTFVVQRPGIRHQMTVAPDAGGLPVAASQWSPGLAVSVRRLSYRRRTDSGMIPEENLFSME